MSTNPINDRESGLNTEIDVIEDYELFYGLDRWCGMTE